MATATTDILVDGQKVSDDDRFLRVSPSRDQNSHVRASSFKNRPRPKLCLDIEAAQRPRTNSLPTPQLFLTLPDPDWMPKEGGMCRVRSFKTTSKGIVNRGDSFKRSNPNVASKSKKGSSNKGPAAKEQSQTTKETRTPPTPSHYRVLMMGSAGSGKSALMRQFRTSEYKGTYDCVSPDVEMDRMIVPVLLDGEESAVEFFDEEQYEDMHKKGVQMDAFVVVFSVTDSGSYNYAVNVVRGLRVESDISKAVILVGNKIDLARQRRVTKSDASKLATKYNCRYAETSAALNHHVDELLVGILSQIRCPDPSLLHPDHKASPRSRSKSPARAALSFFQKLFGQGGSKSKKKPSDNLFVK